LQFRRDENPGGFLSGSIRGKFMNRMIFVTMTLGSFVAFNPSGSKRGGFSPQPSYSFRYDVADRQQRCRPRKS
jgi:hypothetical protein